MKERWSLYLHIPFCQTRCNYCDFVTSSKHGDLIAPYIDALCAEITITADRLIVREPVHSVYFGGGTPSLLTAAQAAKILATIRSAFELTDDAEITLETNPGDLTAERAVVLREMGVNRLSIGMQSGHDDELRLMGRRHTLADTVCAVKTARDAGFENLSLDLIFGYPNQSAAAWCESLELACALRPDHLSLYAMSIESRTPLARTIRSGKLAELSDDLLADRYDFAVDFLEQRGWNRYEISNWSQDPEFESRHNKQYWKLDPYLGFGAAAHGFIAHTRTRNVLNTAAYLRRINRAGQSRSAFPVAAEIQRQSQEDEMRDTMIFGLRLLREGVDLNRFADRFGVRAEAVFADFIREHAAANRIIVADGRARLNPRCAFVSNQIFVDLI